jgi:hypothetical protein
MRNAPVPRQAISAGLKFGHTSPLTFRTAKFFYKTFDRLSNAEAKEVKLTALDL